MTIPTPTRKGRLSGSRLVKRSTHLPETFESVLGVLDGLKHSQVESLGSTQNGVIFLPDQPENGTKNTIENVFTFSNWFQNVAYSPCWLMEGKISCVRFIDLLMGVYKYSDFCQGTGKECWEQLAFINKAIRGLFSKIRIKIKGVGYVSNGKRVLIGSKDFNLRFAISEGLSLIVIYQDELESYATVISRVWDQENACFNDETGVLAGKRGWIGFTKPKLLETVFLVSAYLECMFMHIPASKKVVPNDATLVDLINDTIGWGDNFVKFTKYVTVWPMAKFLKNPVPEKPVGFSGSPLYLRGDMRKMLHARLCSIRDKNSAALYFTILQGLKRACYVVDKGFVSKTLQGHLKTLTSKAESKQLPNHIMEGLRWWLTKEERDDWDFEQYAQRLYSRFRLKRDVMSRVVNPSLSASYENPRTEGGQRNVVYRDYIQSIEGVQGTPVTIDHDLQVMNELGELRYHEFNTKMWAEHVIKSFRDPNVVVMARVEPIIEPIKVRVITAGTGNLYALSKPLQQDMWTYLRQFPQFALIGEQLEESHLVDILNQTNKLGLYEFDQWVSGDFAGATDTLNIKFTLSAFDIMMQNGLRTDMTYLEYYRTMRRVLEPHRLQYDSDAFFGKQVNIEISNGRIALPDEILSNPNILGAFPVYNIQRGNQTITLTAGETTILNLEDGFYKLKSFSVLQETGQLMGSPLSFPLLCAINLICYWMALEIYCEKRVRLQDLPVRINGDDILFMANDRLYEIWQACIASVGFKLSLGKNYVSRDWLTVNSMLFRYDRNDPDRPFSKVDFSNIGMLMSQAKGSLFNIEKKMSLRENYQRAVFTANDPLQAHKRFLFWNKKQLKLMTLDGKYNLFVPLRFGGLGFPVHPDVASSVKVTKFQQRFATFLQYKTEIKMRDGEFPSHYIFSTVSTSMMLNSLKVPAGKAYWSFQPAIGALPYGVKPLEQSDPNKEFRTRGMNSGDLVPVDDEIVYRHPHKSLLREYNWTVNQGRKTGVIQNKLACMPIRKLLYPTETRLCWSRTPIHSMGDTELVKLEGYRDFGSNQQTAPSECSVSVQSTDLN